MYCKNCGKELSSDSKFCAGCGYPINSTKESYYPNTKTQSDVQILAKSTSCKTILDEWRKRLSTALNSGIIIVGLPFIILLLIELINNTRHTPNIPSWIWSAYFIIGVPAIIFFIVCMVLTSQEITKYTGYCNTETLIVDTEKIYGVTIKGKIQLNYDQISRITLNRAMTDVPRKLCTFANDQLIVTDTVGNTFCFYSFNNSKELQAIIEKHVERSRLIK